MTKDYCKIIYESNLAALKLELPFPDEKIYKELKILKKKMVNQIGNSLWKGCALRGIESNKPRPYYEYGYSKERDVPYKWTEISEKCPLTKEFIQSLFPENVLYRVKVNLLEPFGKIHLHSDGKTNALGISDKTTDDDVIIITFAVYWPENVIFNLDSKRIPIKTGDVFLLNFSKFHEVFNNTNEDRYFLAVSGRMSEIPIFKKIVTDSFIKNQAMQFEDAVIFDNENSRKNFLNYIKERKNEKK